MKMTRYNVETDDQVRLENNFTYHAPHKDQPERYEWLRSKAKDLTIDILRLCPPSRERSLALTKLEEAIMWANASIARNEPALPKDTEAIERQPLQSSNLASAGYYAPTKILHIEFLSGLVYQYHGVPQEAFDGLMAAESHGKYFNQNIKEAYKYEKIADSSV